MRAAFSLSPERPAPGRVVQALGGKLGEAREDVGNPEILVNCLPLVPAGFQGACPLCSRPGPHLVRSRVGERCEDVDCPLPLGSCRVGLPRVGGSLLRQAAQEGTVCARHPARQARRQDCRAGACLHTPSRPRRQPAHPVPAFPLPSARNHGSFEAARVIARLTCTPFEGCGKEDGAGITGQADPELPDRILQVTARRALSALQ